MAGSAVLQDVVRVAVCALAAALLLSAAPAAASGPPKWLATARAELPNLKVKAALSMRGYSREQFGTPWADVNDNGCPTREDILARDLKKDVFTTIRGCTRAVLRGVLKDPYTGKLIRFVRGVATSAAVQIDHVVALGDAWRTGAAKWTAALRLAYANDPDVLLAVDGPANGAKSDGDAAEWLPPRQAFDCRYIARQIAIKTKYGLWLTPSERDAMAARLQSC
jgi:Protein of unknown function (DUF1524)